MTNAARIVAVAAAGLAACGVGLGLYARSIPVSHAASVDVYVAAPPEVVRARVADWRTVATWKTDVRSVEDLGVVDGRQRYRECADDCLTIELVRVDDAVVTRIVDNPDFAGTWTWTFTADGDGTRVHLTEDGEVYSAVFRLAMKHVVGADFTIRQTATALAASFDPASAA